MAEFPIRGLTLDLDDTLWPVQVTIERAERALHAWLGEHAPKTAQLDAEARRAIRAQVVQAHPQWHHDLSRMRLETLRAMLLHAGEDAARAEAAFEVFLAARQQVELFADVLPALQRLAARYPVWALTNGNADVHRIGLSTYFAGTVSARDAGAMKPDRGIFLKACEAIGFEPHAVLHVGDDWAMDVEGARRAGLQAAWVDRLEREAPDADAWRVSNLLALCDQLGC